MSKLDDLTQINLDDLVTAFGIQNQPMLAHTARLLFRGPARKFAQQIVQFDAAIPIHGLAEAARRTQKHYVRAVCAAGRAHLPDGPLIALSNHPGITDTLALLAALGRPDMKIIALNRPFLLSLPNLRKELFFVTEDHNERVSLVRKVSGHLRAGGSVLTFPAGHIEPDPDVYPGAVQSLRSWTDSVGVFLRLAPETAVVPIVVRGVIWSKTALHPVMRIKPKRDDREVLAAAVQLLLQTLFDARPITVHVQIGRPISIEGLGSADAQVIHAAVLAQMKHMLEHPSGDAWENVL
jgi:hypothetical protein